MTINNNDVLQARVFFDMPEQVISECTFGYLAVLASPQTDVNVLAALDSQMDDMWTNLVSQIVSGVQLDRMEVNRMEFNSGIWETVANIGETVPGVTFTNGADMLPHATAPYITARTFIPGTRGRKFIPGFGEDLQDESILSAPALTALANFAVDYLAQANISAGNNMVPVVLATVDGLARTFASSQVSSIVGSQRRRKPGVGI